MALDGGRLSARGATRVARGRGGRAKEVLRACGAARRLAGCDFGLWPLLFPYRIAIRRAS